MRGFPAHAPMRDQRYLVRFFERVELPREPAPLALNVEVLSSDGQSIEMRDTDDDVFRAAEELGIDLSRREPSSVEEV